MSFYRIKPKEMFMKLDVKNRWNEVKGRLKQQYDILTDDDLVFRFGQEGCMIERIQKKLGKTKADVLRIIGEA